MKEKIFYLFGIFLVGVLLLSNFGTVFASVAIDAVNEDIKIPKFLLHWSESWAQGNLTELARIRAQIVRQLEWNEKTPPAGTRDLYHLTVDQKSEDQYNIYYEEPYDLIAWVRDEQYMTSLDGDCTRLAAVNFFNENWGEALTHCHPIEVNILWGGGIYAYAKKGPLTGDSYYPWWYEGVWRNYLIAMVANNPQSMWDWDFVGYAEVFSSGVQQYYLGDSYWYAPYDHISISAACPGNWYPIERSDVYVD